MKSFLRLALILLAVGVFASGASAAHAFTLQSQPPAAQPAAGEHAQPAEGHALPAEGHAAEAQGEHPAQAGQSELQERKEEVEEEEHIEFKQSPTVKKLAKLTGLHPRSAYWIFVGINFAILAIFFWWILAKKMNIGGAMRERTAMIQKGMEDARKASAEANSRLSSIEERLSKLDTEAASLRSAADADFAAEDSRIKAATEEDARRVVETAEQEIVAAAKSARSDLKAYAAELAVTLAAKKINVDVATDENLIRKFVGQLGKDGQ